MNDSVVKQLLALVNDLKAETATQTALLKEIKADVQDHEGRIRELEGARNRLMGFVAGIATLAGVVSTCVASWLKHLFGGGN